MVKPPSQYAFNYELAADTFEVRDGLGNKFTVLSVICMGTLYHAAWIVSETGGVPSSLRCAEALGPPKFLTGDRIVGKPWSSCIFDVCPRSTPPLCRNCCSTSDRQR